MTVSEFLALLPAGMAEEIRKGLTIVPDAKAPEEQENLLGLLATPTGLETLLKGLRDTELQTLRLIIPLFACEPFDSAKLEKAGRSLLSGAALKVGLLRLCRKGIVFALRKSWGEQLYVLPSDTLPLWVKLLFPVPADSAAQGLSEGITTLSLEKPIPSARILSLLAYCAREGLPLSQKGTLVKRHQLKLLALLSLDAEEAPIPDMRYVGDDTYPFTLAALLDAVLRLGLLEQREGRYCLNEVKVTSWLTHTEAEMNQAFYASLYPLLLPAEPACRHWVIRSEDWAPGEWFSAEAILGELEARALVRPADLSAERLTQIWLAPLNSLGFVEFGQNGDGSGRARWTVASASSHSHAAAANQVAANGALFVQPDFEIIVPPGVPYAVRWELERLAEQEHAGPVSRYRLTRDRIMGALEAGYEAKGILAILRAHAKYGVPELVEHTITQWSSQHARTSVEEAVIQECRDDSALKKKEEPRPKPKSGANRKQTLANPVETGRGRQKGADIPQGLIYSRVPVQYYDMERTIPRTEDLYPGLQDVPNMWLKECRSYHSATRMDMIRKALEWKASVRLRQQGQERLLVPERLEGTSERWLVAGYNPNGDLRLAPDQWDEMQLVLPGINDEG